MKDSMKSHDASRWFISEPDSVDAAIPDGLGARAMNRSPQVQVTLSDDLLSHLRKTAQEQHVPLRWLVAGLVCDTLETRAEHHDDSQVQFKG
jgi:hypothetical protein